MREDRSLFRRALEISLLVHLIVIFLLMPGVRKVWPSAVQAAERFRVRPEQQERPLEFELVDLPDQKEEKPPDEPVPLSDMDRRAHGGEGEDNPRRPEVRGNTPQLVQAQGGRRLERGTPPRDQGPPQRTLPQPQARPPVPQPEETRPRDREAAEEPAREGAGEGEPAEPRPKPSLRLPPPGSWALPPDVGGLPEMPDRRGGRAEPGALSFDTRWYDWGPYAAAMLRKIRRNWRIPEIAMLGVEGVVKIRFYIERDGTVTGLQILDESGKPPMDFAARDAIANSSPFNPLPSDLTGVEREGVTITFYYNTSPSEWNR